MLTCSFLRLSKLRRKRARGMGYVRISKIQPWSDTTPPTINYFSEEFYLSLGPTTRKYEEMTYGNTHLNALNVTKRRVRRDGWKKVRKSKTFGSGNRIEAVSSFARGLTVHDLHYSLLNKKEEETNGTHQSGYESLASVVLICSNMFKDIDVI